MSVINVKKQSLEITYFAVYSDSTNGDRLSQWEMANFGPIHNPNQSTDCEKNCHS